MKKTILLLLLFSFVACGSGDAVTFKYIADPTPVNQYTTVEIQEQGSLVIGHRSGYNTTTGNGEWNRPVYSFGAAELRAPLPDTIKTQICAIRGHHLAGRKRVVDNNCPKYIIDAPTYSLLVQGGCNQISRTCERCGTEVIEQAPQRRDTIWRFRPVEGAAGGR